MSSAGTLLSDLDSKGPVSDGDSDLVQKILADMNGGSSGGGGNSIQMPSRGMASPPPPLPNQGLPVPQGTTMLPQTTDPRIPQAHVIGGDSPTAADFAAAMHGVPRADNAQYYAGGQMPQPGQMQFYPEEPRKNMYARIIEEAKTPLLVSLIVFVLSLPAVNVLFAHYLPSLVLPTGSLTMVGLVAKALIAGTLFWTLQRVVAPLLQS
jgi:hypothetical protein